MNLHNEVFRLLAGDARADRVVPPTGFTAWLTILASAAMALLGTFALAFLWRRTALQTDGRQNWRRVRPSVSQPLPDRLSRS